MLLEGKNIVLTGANRGIGNAMLHRFAEEGANLWAFARRPSETFEQDCQQILKMMMAETSKVFEQLPILEDAEILRNILYAGVWTRYGQIRCRRKETKKEA